MTLVQQPVPVPSEQGSSTCEVVADKALAMCAKMLATRRQTLHGLHVPTSTQGIAGTPAANHLANEAWPRKQVLEPGYMKANAGAWLNAAAYQQWEVAGWKVHGGRPSAGSPHVCVEAAP